MSVWSGAYANKSLDELINQHVDGVMKMVYAAHPECKSVHCMIEGSKVLGVGAVEALRVVKGVRERLRDGGSSDSVCYARRSYDETYFNLSVHRVPPENYTPTLQVWRDATLVQRAWPQQIMDAERASSAQQRRFLAVFCAVVIALFLVIWYTATTADHFFFGIIALGACSFMCFVTCLPMIGLGEHHVYRLKEGSGASEEWARAWAQKCVAEATASAVA